MRFDSSAAVGKFHYNAIAQWCMPSITFRAFSRIVVMILTRLLMNMKHSQRYCATKQSHIAEYPLSLETKCTLNHNL